MAEKKKAAILIDEIVSAKNRDEGIEVLHNILEALHLSQSYTKMVSISDELIKFSAKVKQIEDKIDDSVKTHEELNDIRFELDTLYRKVNDALTHKVDSAKIYYDEIKSTRRYEALVNLKDSQKAKDMGAKSPSALETIIGGDASYTRLAVEKSISYANYKKLERLLKNIERLGNTVASREKRELIILGKDPK